MATVENWKRYRWAYPSDWLNDKVSEYADADNVAELVSIINSLVYGLPEDEIQDRFESEMNADGYFAADDGEE